MLAHIMLSGNSISGPGAAALFAGCASSSSLATVALDHNDVRGEGVHALLRCLEKNAGIVHVRMDNTNSPEALRIAAEMLLEARREKQ